MNLSAQRESHYARSLIEASLNPLVTVNTDGMIMDMNQATSALVGIPRDKILGSDFSIYFTENQRAREVYKQAFDNGIVTETPLTMQHIGGKTTNLMFNGTVFKDNVGDVVGVVLFARDITEQIRVSQEITNAKEIAENARQLAEHAKSKAEKATLIAEDAVKTKQQFLSNMSHEIRTPMNAILGFTKVLLRTSLSHEQKEYLKAIKTSSDALIVLINDILDMAKVDAGKMTFDENPFDLDASISAMLHLFETKIEEKNLKLIKEYDVNIPKVLAGDAMRLRQIILNLMSNAVKFTALGSIKVKVSLLSENEECAVIKFSIEDTGIGIAQNNLSGIFESFQQATSDTSKLYGGTGLGLAIAKKLVDEQGGTIEVMSEIDKGSTFSFSLKYKKSNDTPLIELKSTVEEFVYQKVYALVVEDIPLNQMLLKTLLDDFGFQYDIAVNGKQAIEKLNEKLYDIILMDLQMPVMNGFEATKHIREVMRLDTPIIALTAHVTSSDLEKCITVGMNDYITKPLDEVSLQKKIVHLVNQSHIELVQVAHTAMEHMKDCKGIKHINLTKLDKLVKSNPILMSEMISIYLNQTPKLISTAMTCLEEENWDTLAKVIHKIIPSLSIVGIDLEYEKMAREIQNLLEKEIYDEVPNLVKQLEPVINQSCRELEEELIMLKKK